jgi:hypothetical protein
VGDPRKADKRGERWSGNSLRYYQRLRGESWLLMASTSLVDGKETRMGTWKSTHPRPRPTMYKLLQHQPNKPPHSHSNPPKLQLSQPPKQPPQSSPESSPPQTLHSPAHPDSHPPRIIKSIPLKSQESSPDHHSHYPCLEGLMPSAALVHQE